MEKGRGVVGGGDKTHFVLGPPPAVHHFSSLGTAFGLGSNPGGCRAGLVMLLCAAGGSGAVRLVFAVGKIRSVVLTIIRAPTVAVGVHTKVVHSCFSRESEVRERERELRNHT